ncbi:MAG: DUF362 domain-containing protein, partial [Phycisphaerae bacterium]
MANEHAFDGEVTRRGFLGMGVAAGGAVLLGGRLALAAEAKTDVWVIHGTDKKKLMDAALKVISDSGGFGKDVKKLTLKINAAWWSTPEEGGNTHPELVDTFLKGCKGQGIKQLVMPEHPVQPAGKTFPRSGLLAVAKSNGANMIDMGSAENLWKDVALPKAKNLKNAQMPKDILETDALVNMPVAKHHGGAGLTIAMKNWLGSVKDRRFLHRNDLHQCIADLHTFIKPTWTVVDATRIMLDRGPKGPTKNMKKLDLLIVSRDQVAADVYTATLFPKETAARAKHLQ